MTPSDKRAMHARQRSIDNAVEFLKKRPGFAGAQAQAIRQRTEWEDRLSAQEKLPASPHRLQAVLRLIDIRGELYLTLVNDMASQEAFMAMMNAFTDQAWEDYVGFSVYQAPPMEEDTNYKAITDRGRHWVSEGYDRVHEKEKEPTQQVAKARTETPENPKVFISYSWDDETHKRWVFELAKRLRSEGIDAIIDQTHLALGGDTPEFMERSILESRYVLVICTELYKARFDGRVRGTGYEGHIITAQMVARVGSGKFIPVLRSHDWGTALPTALQGIWGTDLRKDSEDEYRRLLAQLHGVSTILPVGAVPEWLVQPTTPRNQISPHLSDAFLPPTDLALLSEKRNSSLVIWLENHSLDPMKGCRFILTNLQRFSQLHGDFERNPFTHKPMLREQTINAGGSSNEAIPLAGFQQTTKRTLLIFRTFAFESAVILLAEILIEGGGKTRTETKFISWNPGEDPELIDDPKRLVHSPQTARSTTLPAAYGEQRKSLPETEIIRKILERPRWLILSCPEEFKRARFRDLDHCAEFIASANVRSRGQWTQYPWFPKPPARGEEWVAGEVELDDSAIRHWERWVLFRSGQFVHNLALDEMPVLSGRTHVLEILNTATALFEFIGRMADQKIISGRTLISLEFHKVEGHQLTWPQDAFQINDLVDRRSSWCQDESFTVEQAHSSADLVDHRRELALEASLKIYSGFGWTDPPTAELRNMQQERFGPPIHF